MKNLKAIAKKIFKAVEYDLTSRKGIGNEWEEIDTDIKKEIREDNVARILDILEKELVTRKSEDK